MIILKIKLNKLIDNSRFIEALLDNYALRAFRFSLAAYLR